MHIFPCWRLPKTCVHLHESWQSTWTHYPVCTCACLCVSVCAHCYQVGAGVLEAGRAHRSGREGGRLQLSLQLPTGCEGHWCDSTNYRGRKPALQTFTAAAQQGSAGLNPPSTSHFTPLIPPGGLYFKSVSPKQDIIHRQSSATLLWLMGCRKHAWK